MSTLFVVVLAGGLIMGSASSNEDVANASIGITSAVFILMVLNAWPKLAPLMTKGGTKA